LGEHLIAGVTSRSSTTVGFFFNYMNKVGNGIHNRILVVDDEPRILRFIRLSLSSQGFDVITASGGEDALKMITDERPDLMVLDIFMPGLDGFAVLERLRKLEENEDLAHLPVIVVSARNSVAEQAFNLGANDFIAKPFLLEDMTEKIHKVIDRLSSS
jgi:DNA-binding response OmpR family regulator